MAAQSRINNAAPPRVRAVPTGVSSAVRSVAALRTPRLIEDCTRWPLAAAHFRDLRALDELGMKLHASASGHTLPHPDSHQLFSWISPNIFLGKKWHYEFAS